MISPEKEEKIIGVLLNPKLKWNKQFGIHGDVSFAANYYIQKGEVKFKLAEVKDSRIVLFQCELVSFYEDKSIVNTSSEKYAELKTIFVKIEAMHNKQIEEVVDNILIELNREN